MLPFFSVVLCTYNRAHLLGTALDSLLNQTEDSWELIVVDDGSTDETEVLVRYEFSRPAFGIREKQYIRQHNGGVGHARTVGIAAARGLYITFLDSDDEYLPGHLASRRRVLEAHPEMDIIHGGVEIIGDPFVADRTDTARRLHISECVMEGTMCIRREVAVRLGGFGKERYAEGAAFMERAVQGGFQVMKVQMPTYRYNRTTPDSLCTAAFQTVSTFAN